MKEKSGEQMKLGLDCYDPEHRVFPMIDEMKEKNLSKRDILLTLKWKTNRIKDLNIDTVSDDEMVRINRAVRDAHKQDCRIDALETLGKSRGIGLAVATAILTVCYPDEFTIIDTRVLEQLALYPARIADKRMGKKAPYVTGDWTATEYIKEYLPRVKQHSEHWGCTLRDADRALWGLSVNKRIEEVIAKSKRGRDSQR